MTKIQATFGLALLTLLTSCNAFHQKVNQSPGTGTFSDHTFEILVMLLGAFLLGLWLGWILWSRYKQMVENLQMENSNLNASISTVRGELEALKIRFTTTESEKNALNTRAESLAWENNDFKSKISSLETDLMSYLERNKGLETELGIALAAVGTTQTSEEIPMEVVTTNTDISAPETSEETAIELELPALPTVEIDIPAEIPALAPIDAIVEEPAAALLPVDMPEVSLELPSVEVPTIEIPSVEVPAIELPALEIPSVELPSVEIPVVETLVVAAALAPETPASPDPEVIEIQAHVETPAEIVEVVKTYEETAEPVLLMDAEPVSLVEEVPVVEIETPQIEETPAPAEVVETLVAVAPEPEITQTAALVEETIAPLVVPATVVDQRDDLKIVEGIGPKIEELLFRNGIHTFTQLASTPVNRLKEILVSNGPSYAMHDPGTWPAQALLAANSEWENLRAYQSFLNAGKRPN